MPKRRLSQKQKIQITQNQEKNIESHSGEEGLLIAHYGKYVDIETLDKKIIQCKLRQSLPTLVVGDHILCEPALESEGVVLALLPRTNLLCRPDSRGQIKAVAANITQMIIVFAVEPAISTLLLDSYLIAAELNCIKPVIVINKIDLISPHEQNELKIFLSLYEKLGYPVLLTDCKKENGLKSLKQVMPHQISIFVGQSGVGKSSIITHFIPDTDIAVGEISNTTKLGRHTTTTSRLYHLAGGGSVIDSPGVREFGLGQISLTELTEGFIELAPYKGLCKFRNCHHETEPQCALRTALEAGNIAPSRFENFKKLMQQTHQ